MPNKTNKKGFTLIEIVIVLAIAALIMVVVFLAVAGAQRNQRDQVRKDVVNRAKAQMEQAKGNNNGSYPTTYYGAGGFAQTYMNAPGDVLTQSGLTLTFSGAPSANGTACNTATTTTGGVSISGGATTGLIGSCLEANVWYTLTYP